MEKLGYRNFPQYETGEDDPEQAKVIDFDRARAQRSIEKFLKFQERILSGEISLKEKRKTENRK